MTISDRIQKIVSSAIDHENDGVKFYTDALEKVSHPLGKAVFKSFVDEEKKHIEKIKRMFSEKIDSSNISSFIEYGEPVDRLKDVFRSMYNHDGAVTDPNADDIEAVHEAIEFEKKSFEVYDKAAAEATNQTEREVLTFFANEEKSHLSVLKNMHDELEQHYKEDARNEQQTQLEWEKKLFMRPDAEARKIKMP